MELILSLYIWEVEFICSNALKQKWTRLLQCFLFLVLVVTYRLRDFLFYGVVSSSFRYIVAPITMQSFGEIVWQTYLFLGAYPSIVPHVLYYGVIKYSIFVMINY